MHKWVLENRFDVLINRFDILKSTDDLCQGIIFYRPDGRLVKLLLFSKLLDKSPLTFIYFTTFKKKSQVSPTHTTKLFGFRYNFTFFDYMSTYVLELSFIMSSIIVWKIARLELYTSP